MFLRNSWYVAASGHEAGRKPLRRVILGEPVVLFRTEDGPPVALEDRCAHRHLPLSMGKLIGDTLQCHYHGLRYDRTGACVGVPGQDLIPPSARVRSYPLVERYRWLWIWMGDPALADPGRITDYHWLDDPSWGAASEYLHVKANWQLIVDNLLDLTHLAFVHETTIGNSALVEHASVKVQRAHDNVAVTRWIIDQPPPPTFVKVGGFTGNVDRWQIIDFVPPAFLRLDVGATPTGTGAPEGHRVGGISMRNLNAITPETETTSHYFWGQAHDFDIHNPHTTEKVVAQIRTAFLEDVAVFEAQQVNLDLVPNPPQTDINADTGVIQARRILDRLHQEEATAAPRVAAE
ncbi:MAG TPA: aromatic ring-hydroxylating dioxygenase subunit alpha [Xanthobacteraceae bacterium]|nr:aromatic ring-hydroxylating dioxygenase subunit alpha [Xanthobacteraceae bacterium]